LLLIVRVKIIWSSGLDIPSYQLSAMTLESLLTKSIDLALPIFRTTRMRTRLHFLRSHHRLLNLRHPRTFSEKLQYYKLFHRDPRLPGLADKVLVKEHVAAELGQEWVIPTIWSGPVLPPRQERRWPIPYVIKANHGSEWIMFVRSHEEQDWERIEKTTSQWMAKKFGTYGGEWHYGPIRRQILIEPFLGGENGLPWDYKFWVFGGKAQYIEIDTGRGVSHRRVFYDRNWVRQPFTYKTPMDERHFERPASFDRMMAAAEHLAADFPFVRVDFYEVGGAPIFGEMTFTPTSGWGVFNPVAWDEEFGRLMPDLTIRRRPAVPIPAGTAVSVAEPPSGEPKLPI
jgi:hypothetical protein